MSERGKPDRCAACGAGLATDASACPACGAATGAKTGPDREGQVMYGPPPPPRGASSYGASGPLGVCEGCGRHVDAAAETCPFCGATPGGAGARIARPPSREVQVMYGPPPFIGGRRSFFWAALAAGATAAAAAAWWFRARLSLPFLRDPAVEYGPPRRMPPANAGPEAVEPESK